MNGLVVHDAQRFSHRAKHFGVLRDVDVRRYESDVKYIWFTISRLPVHAAFD